jgi:23S rRNA pseudouridine2604 synthase
MCEFLDYRVTKLQRVRIMNIELDIPVGKWREFTKDELEGLNLLLESSQKTN